MQEGKESEVSRMHRIVDGELNQEPGLISVLGGKITGFRAIAQEVTDLVCRKLKLKSDCKTDQNPLPGGHEAEFSPTHPLSRGVMGHLRSIYGARAEAIAQLVGSNLRLGEPLGPGSPDIAAQVVFSVREEQCLRVSDFMARRSMLAFSPDQGVSVVGPVAKLMAEELSWSKVRTGEEIERYGEQYIAPTQLFKKELDPNGAASV